MGLTRLARTAGTVETNARVAFTKLISGLFTKEKIVGVHARD